MSVHRVCQEIRQGNPAPTLPFGTGNLLYRGWPCAVHEFQGIKGPNVRLNVWVFCHFAKPFHVPGSLRKDKRWEIPVGSTSEPLPIGKVIACRVEALDLL